MQSKDVLNLDVIDDAFGKSSDLYRDVLQISKSAGPGQIHDAYFERRDKLYETLSSVDNRGNHRTRREAERKMDAVVCAIRVLGNPDLRAQYDRMRSQRIGSRKNRLGQRRIRASEEVPELNISTTTGSTMMSKDESYEPKSRSISYTMETPSSPGSPERRSPIGVQRSSARITPEKKSRSRRRKSEESASVDQSESINIVVTPEKVRGAASSRQAPATDHRDDSSQFSGSSSDEGTMMTVETYDVPKPPTGFFEKVKAEVVGALDDTSRSFEQVFSAFTLREEDIQAVVTKIDKAKVQIRTGSVLPAATQNDDKKRGRSRSAHKSRSKSASKSRKGRR